MPHRKKLDTVQTVSPSVKTDSVKSLTAVKKEVQAPSLFQNHLLVPHQKYPQLHITNYEYVIFSVLLFLVMIFVWLYALELKTLKIIVRDFFSFNAGMKRNRDVIETKNRAVVLLTLFFVVTLSLLIGQILKYYDINSFATGLPDELGIAVLIIGVYFIKLLSVKITGVIFKATKETDNYVSSIISYFGVTGLFMLPLVIMLFFLKQIPSKVFLFVGFGFIAVMLITRILNGFIFGLNSAKIGKLYLFIYLCALEILPLIIIIKLIILGIK